MALVVVVAFVVWQVRRHRAEGAEGAEGVEGAEAAAGAQGAEGAGTDEGRETPLPPSVRRLIRHARHVRVRPPSELDGGLTAYVLGSIVGDHGGRRHLEPGDVGVWVSAPRCRR